MEMRRFLLIITLLLTFLMMAQDNGKSLDEKGEIIKKGWNFGPLPVVGHNGDMGFRLHQSLKSVPFLLLLEQYYFERNTSFIR